MNPLTNYNIKYENGGFIRIKGTPQVMTKLLLPRSYTKANIKNTSLFYRYLSSIPPKISYTYESTSVR
jgi:hypothetical protein